MKITIPNLSLVVLIGPSGSGKSTLAGRHFLPTEVLSSDVCRGLVSDDANDQTATNDAFEVLDFIASKRLAAGKLTVIDATNVQPQSRRGLVALARRFHVLPVAIVLNLPEKACVARNAQRRDRNFGPHVIRNQRSQLRRSIRGLKREGFRHVTVLETPEEIEAVSIDRVPLWNDRREMTGRLISSATCMGAAMSWKRCWRSWGMKGGIGFQPVFAPMTGWKPIPPGTPTPTGGWRFSSGTWSIGGRGALMCLTSFATWWPPGPRCACQATMMSN